MVKVMKLRLGNTLRKMVLLKLADQANDCGECWPSYQTIADACECSRSAVKAQVRELEKMGLLRRSFRSNGTSTTSNLFRLDLSLAAQENHGHEKTRADADPGQDITPPGQEETAPRAASAPKPVIEPVSEPNTPQPPSSGGLYSDEFEQFWSEYPKRVGKGGAFKLWKKIPATDRQAILADLPVRRRTHDPWLSDGGKYIPNPTTYLNQRRWEDDIVDDKSQAKAPREVVSWI